MTSHDFLMTYQLRTTPMRMVEVESEDGVDVTGSTSPNRSSTSDKTDNQDSKLDGVPVDTQTKDTKCVPDQLSVSCKLVRRRVLLSNCEVGDFGGACGSGDGVKRQAGFFEEGWRSKLCTCVSCKVRQKVRI